MYALGLLFELVLGWSFTSSVLLSAVIVLVYTFLGGLTSAIYNEVLQFFLIVLGFAPLAILAVDEGRRLERHCSRGFQPVMTHAWKYVGHATQNPMGVEVFGLVAGLGLCAFLWLLVHGLSGCSARDGGRIHVGCTADSADRRIPEDFHAVYRDSAGDRRGGADEHGVRLRAAAESCSGYDYDQALTTLMAQFYPSGMLGVGLTALMASFMSGMAGNVTAFNTVFTYDIYQSYIRRERRTQHYLWVGRVTTVVGVVLSIATAYLAHAVQQHHGFSATRLRLRERAAIRHVSAGDVLEARNRARRISGACFREPAAAALTHGLTVAEGKGGWIAHLHEFPSTWLRISGSPFSPGPRVSSSPSSSVLSPSRKPETELHNLVYGVTDLPHEAGSLVQTPGPLALIVIVVLSHHEPHLLVTNNERSTPSYGISVFASRTHSAGLRGGQPERTRPADSNVNVNLWCGLTLLVFGGVLLWLSYRAKS